MFKGIIKRGVICCLAALLCVMPFSFKEASANTTLKVSGINVIFNGADISYNTQNTAFVSEDYTIQLVFDNYYIGYFSGIFSYQYAFLSSSGTTYYDRTKNVSGYLNGSVYEFGISIMQALNNTIYAGDHLNSRGFTLSSANVFINNSLSYQFPIESVNFISSMDSYNYSPSSFNTLSYNVYPVYDLPAGSEFMIATVNPSNDKANDYTIIFGVNKNVYNATSFNSLLDHSSTNTYSNYTFEYVETLYRNNLAPFSIVKGHLFSNDNQTQTVRFKVAQALKFMPVYANYTPLLNLSTDFALQFNLDNRLLLDIEALNQGSQESQSAGDNIDNVSSSLDTASDQLHNFDTQYLNNMNTQMNNIDFTGDGVALINNGNFLSSANWVRTQFNRMTSNNVFGTMIYFSLVLGLSLLVLGKLRK